MKLKSFGCSFVYGSDLNDVPLGQDLADHYSHQTWPALISQNMQVEYECWACPGQGNFKILSDIVSQASLDDPAVFVINWTWIDRFDYVDANEIWHTIRPGDDTPAAKQYYRLFNSQIKDMMTSVYAINTAIEFLNQRAIPFAMSYMDYAMLEPVDPEWHDPKYLSAMQTRIRKHLVDFDGQNFLDWSRAQGFEISDTWHPLERAHRAAADHMLPVIDAILRRA